MIEAGGAYLQPVVIRALDPEQELVVTVAALVSDSVTVSGSAPSVESTPASGTTTISGADVRCGSRQTSCKRSNTSPA